MAEQPKPKGDDRKVDPRGLRSGEFGDTKTTQIPQRRSPAKQPKQKTVLRDNFGREIPVDFAEG